MPKYSIITPVYNSFDLMERYFNSLNSQTFKDFEVILVDDCSTDDSYECLKEYTRRTDLNIVLCKTEKNAGPGNARNVGLLNAKSEYVLFVDSDDYVASDLIEKIDNRENQEDMIFFNYFRISDKYKVIGKTVDVDECNCDKSEIILSCTTSVWGKAIRKEIIEKNNICFPDYKRFEDWVFMFKTIINCKSFAIIDDALYFYYNNPKSIVNNSEIKGYVYSQKAYQKIESELNNYSEKLSEAIYIREVLYVAVKDLILSSEKNFFWQEIDRLQRVYPEWHQNPYIHTFTKLQQIVLRLIQFRQYKIVRVGMWIMKFVL